MRRVCAAVTVLGILLLPALPGCGKKKPTAPRQSGYRWMFVWRTLSNPREVDRLLADIPRAAKAGYNGLVLDWDVAPEKKEELKAAAARYQLDLIPRLTERVDRSFMEGLPVRGARYVVHGGAATLVPEPAVSFPDGGFEQAQGDRFTGWDLQVQPGICTFQDAAIKHGGNSSVRLENPRNLKSADGFFIGKVVKVAPYHQYRVSVWIRSEQCRGKEIGISVRGKHRPVTGSGPYQEHPGNLYTNIRGEGPNSGALCFSPGNVGWKQDWQPRSVVFNSLGNSEVRICFGAWELTSGRVWWDDAKVEEVGLLNVLRRPGTPVVVKGNDGTLFQEGRDYERIADPWFNIEIADHPQPTIRLIPTSRITEGQRLSVSYYHPVLIHYGCSTCLTEPKVFDAYRQEVTRINAEIHPPAFFMQHDEIRIANWCMSCQSKHMTPGQLLAENVRQCAAIIKGVRPDAQIWVWSDMFDPQHNAHDAYYLVNGTMAGTWEGLPAEVGVVNWAHHLKGKNVPWFAKLGHRQILSGYYDEQKDREGTETRAWLKASEGQPGVVGAMYTTWRSDYGPLETWAKGVWGR